MNPLSLYELNALVRGTLEDTLQDEYWLQAELSDVRTNASGHCYLEFIQKDEHSHSLVAKARGTIWANIFRLLKPYFEEATGQLFTSGIKVLVKVAIGFHELYGYSLTVLDIDPTYTLGDMARRRREILKQLEEEGVLTMNKELEMPLLPQRIAVISSASAAGYGDFNDQLHNNPYGFYFYTELFPAIMQGDRVEESLLAALDAINQRFNDFDAVVIIRGGGATSDLSGFETYLLAAACAQFPYGARHHCTYTRQNPHRRRRILNRLYVSGGRNAGYIICTIKGIFARINRKTSTHHCRYVGTHPLCTFATLVEKQIRIASQIQRVATSHIFTHQ